ncbi:Protein transport protein Sec61 subunit alpha [Aphanomyces cochlioides]|nr:Protein transport protein Sec61 subunit alpha [Aphanomyces cochlioides]
MSVLPDVSQPDRRIPFREKVVWTVVCLLIFLVCSQLPLYGVKNTSASDSLYWMRAILASNRGTLMELGVGPIVTSGLVLQLLAGSNLLEVDQSSKEDRALFAGAQKLVGVFITLAQAIAYVFAGMYGDVNEIGAGSAILIIVQLFFAGLVVIALDETLQKGYGFGSGVSLFIATNVCQNIVWDTFAPVSITTGRGTEYRGAVVAFFHVLIARENKLNALKEAFYRQNLPNVTNVLATALMFVLITYVHGFRIDLPIKYQKFRAQQGAFPVKLFYTSNMPIILQTALVSNFYFASQLLFKRFGDNIFIRLIGVWSDVEGTTGAIPVSGLAYYISAPGSAAAILYDPIRAIVYVAFVLGSCAFFANVWTEVSGSASRDIARQLRDQQMVMKGHRDTSVVHVLNRYIPVAATFGGVAVGALVIISDFLGAIGSGTGVLLAVTIIYQYFEAFAREQTDLQSLLGFS